MFGVRILLPNALILLEFLCCKDKELYNLTNYFFERRRLCRNPNNFSEAFLHLPAHKKWNMFNMKMPQKD